MSVAASQHEDRLTAEDMLNSLSLAETADLFRVSPDTIKRWIRAGKLGAVRAGRTYRVPQCYVERRLNDLATEAAS